LRVTLDDLKRYAYQQLAPLSVSLRGCGNCIRRRLRRGAIGRIAVASIRAARTTVFQSVQRIGKRAGKLFGKLRIARGDLIEQFCAELLFFCQRQAKGRRLI
jgi:hypothetical protein